ncbi:hypothetical protein CWR48_18230 [Oceanobacillus arenosus]|uniref:Uncharacterized protein n=1 Tax=Oceanobacillus arenosus TaxID=1229153 RepID=A0A3D8PJ94_9BACI|nr:hypothetical protein CWR48_18230 [Oceanobacillus arenosus]
MIWKLKLALYKARFGEVEYYDLSDMSIIMKSDTIQKLATYFKGKTEKLRSHIWADIASLEQNLEILRNQREVN